jgi:hypothetical protein
VSGDGDLWEKAFQLAFFLIPDRASAYQIAGRAVEKLGVQRSREKRRAYWRGRNTELKIRRISRPDADILQWLVYLESEECEKEQERNGLQTELDLVIRYIKHLVQLSTAASSFYVNVGVNRLLRNYSTPEVQQVYEFTTELYPASEEYRKVKGRLMNQLAARFDRFLKIRTLEYGELRFETYADQKPWLRLVEQCLEAFTPWSSREACLQGAIESSVWEPASGARHPGFSNKLDAIETNRCHWFMHSRCYGELAKKLALDPPGERLCVPQFFFRDRGGQDFDPTGTRRKIPPLTDAEVQLLKDRMDSSEARRQQAHSQPLKILAQGVVYARLDPVRDEKRKFDIQDGTKLLEVWTEANGQDLILATHWIDYTERNGIAAGEYTIAVKNRRELVFKVVPAAAGTEQEGGATVMVESRSSWPLPAWSDLIASFVPARQNLPGYALAAVLFISLGWLARTANDRSRLAHVQTTAEHIAPDSASRATAIVPPEQGPPEPAQIVATYFFAPEKPILRGMENPQERVVTFAHGDSLLKLDLAVVPGEHASYRAALSSFPGEQELLRENALSPRKKGNNWVVEFALPSALVVDRTHYLVTLSAADRGGRATAISRFLFEVQK